MCLVWAGNAAALTGNQKLVVVLCKFKNKTDEPKQPPYFQAMFDHAGIGITVDADEGVFSGGADPRSDGAAIGY